MTSLPIRSSRVCSRSEFLLLRGDERSAELNWRGQLVGLSRGSAAGGNNCIERSIYEHELVITSPALLGYFVFGGRLRTNGRVLVQKGTGTAI